ncbi:hypothetical protein EV562_109136 [Streptomyces sp. BK208]|uniref:hypothetical protein n=1 Tax=Streptomyces sp. BK208 TaxID=2512150 RepID=UPI001061D4B1|nr:hypothetical protein [Streptomyces sp. BK208]TDT35196.1 hypothetical protein EV562_109136 [Streptomyces sp. BK208]
MRMLLKATMDTETSNELIRSGRMQDAMRKMLDDIKPEAAYFGALGGRRTALLVFDMQNNSDMPRIGEPFFSELKAEIEVCPIMNAEDLSLGLHGLR